MHTSHLLWLTTTTILSFPYQALSQSSPSSKRGIAYIGDPHRADYNLFLSRNSPISWYYNWSPWPSSDNIPSDSAVEFVPLIHGISNLDADTRTVKNLPSRNTHHLLTFNEPDGTTSSGGSNIAPEAAARAYIEQIVPLRSQDHLLISHPSVTGSGPGLDWLRRFNESCWEIDPDSGCPTDFVAAHWYGNFVGLASWLGQVHEFYGGDSVGHGGLPVWITELALPQADVAATSEMMNQTLPYLDGLAYVERYAWFGMFRPDDANQWTGDGVALLDDDGGLTDLGATYLGGEGSGFRQGQRGSGGENSAGSPGQAPTSVSTTWLVGGGKVPVALVVAVGLGAVVEWLT